LYCGIMLEIHILSLIYATSFHHLGKFMYQFLSMTDNLKQTEIEAILQSPIPYLPLEICVHIWSYLDKRSLSKATRACRSWNLFSIPFLVILLEEDCFSRTFKKQLFIKYCMDGDLAKTEKIKFCISTMNVNGNVNEFAKDIRSELERSDAVLFFTDKSDENQINSVSEFTEKFQLLKDYSDEFPSYIFSATSKLKTSKTLTFVETPEEFCGTIAQDLCVEKRKEKGIGESLVHKVGRKRDLIKACCASVFVSATVAIVVAIPGIVIVVKHQDTISIVFSAVFLSLGVCELVVGAYLCMYFSRTWYAEERNSNPRYRKTCLSYDACC